MSSKDDIFFRIKENYNKAIGLCKTEPLGSEAAKSEVICGIEQTMEQPIALRPNPRRLIRNVPDEDEDPMASMEKQMCGCRLTAMIMFVMALLDIDTPNGKLFLEKYTKLINDPIIKKIMGSGFNESEFANINKKIPNILPSIPNLYIVQILKMINWPGVGNFYTPVHSFIVNINTIGNCYVLSSWFDGGESQATPVVYNELGFYDLQQMLIPTNLHIKEITNKLFGQDNNLEGNLLVLFLSKELFTSSLKGGKKRNKSKRKKRKKGKKDKSKRRNKRKTKRK